MGLARSKGGNCPCYADSLRVPHHLHHLLSCPSFLAWESWLFHNSTSAVRCRPKFTCSYTTADSRYRRQRFRWGQRRAYFISSTTLKTMGQMKVLLMRLMLAARKSLCRWGYSRQEVGRAS